MPSLPAPVVSEVEVEIAGLDERHDGLRIAHLSDIHVGNLTPANHVRAAIELANRAKPDVVVLTGDYVCWRRDEVERAREQLAGLRARRVLAVLGNHDYFTSAPGMTAALTGCGYDVLKNANTDVDLDGAALRFVGVDDPVTRHADLERAFAGVPERAPRIVLCHAPDHAPKVARHGADLILSGHTHGGQIYIKGFTDRIMKRIGLNFRRGMFTIGERTQLYVTPGVGFSGVTHRQGDGTDAEVAVLTLRSRTAKQATGNRQPATGNP
jgi:predicted MPP superfamily phosphohydrolase